MDEIPIDTKLWWLHPVNPNTLYGAEGRANSRAQKRRAVEKKALKMIATHRPEWLQANNQIITLDEVNELLHQLRPIAITADDYKFMHNFVCHRLAAGNKAKAWQAQVPPPVQTQKREAPPRAVSDFNQINQWRNIQQRFIDWLTHNDPLFATINPLDKHSKKQQLAQSIVFSALAFGGLCEPESLSALLTAVANGQIYQSDNHVWLELYYVSKSKAITANAVNANATLRRWFPDALTLGLINYWHQQGFASGEQHEFEASKLMTDLLKTLNANQLAKISLTSLGKIAAQVYEIDHNQTPSFISGWQVGLNESHSLPNHVWCKLAGRQSAVELPEQTQLTAPTAESHSLSLAFEFSQTGDDHNYLQQLRQLRDCLRPDDKNGKRLTQHQAVTKLQQLCEQQLKTFSPAVQLLAHWSLSLLTVGSRYKAKLKPQSVNNYLATIGRALVVATQSENLLMYATDEFELLYQELAGAYANKPKRMARMLARFDEFHSFLTREYDVEPLNLPIKLKGRDLRATVCANYINQHEYQQLLHHIHNNESLLINDRNAMANLLTLAYRTGLRVGELSKLTLKDFYQGNDWLLLVRTNQWGPNKSESAYRLVPLRQLLNQQEFSAFASYVSHRATMPKQQNLLVFSEPTLPNQKLDARTIRHFIVKPLRQICADQTVTFHTLRHSAINNWYLKLFVQPQNWIFNPNLFPDIPLHIGYLVGAGTLDAGRELYAIAGMAGHASPQQTLLSYCHFLDLHSYLSYNLNEGPTNIDLFSRLLNEKPATIQREINRKAKTCPAQSVLKQRIQRQMQSWTKQLELDITDPLAVEATASEHYHLDSTGILTITNRYDHGHSMQTIATELGITMPKLEGVIAAAKKLAELKTVKGRSRLIAHNRQRKIPTQFITAEGQQQSDRSTISPGEPTDKNELNDAHQILNNLRGQLKSPTSKADTLWFIQYLLNHVTTTKPGVPVHNINDAKRFITVLKQLVNPGRIYLLHHAANPKYQPASYNLQQVKYTILNQLSINERAYFQIGTLKAKSEDHLGKLQICLMSQSQNQKCTTGRPKAASSLVFACHVAGIGLGV